VNHQITRLAVTAVLLLASLIVATTYWQAWAAPDLAARQDNSIQRVAEFSVERGDIYVGQTKVARNVKRRIGGKTLFFRRYPTRGLYAHIVGYSTQVRSRAGLEQSLNDFLTGANTNLTTVLETSLDKLRGSTVQGNDVHLTLRPRAQRVAFEQLGGRCGAVVVLELQTGRVLVMASTPTYDPNLVERNFGAILNRPRACPAPLVNRAAAGLYAPGSTFKVVTGAEALDSGTVKPDTTFVDPGYCIEYGDRVNNYDTSSPFGTVTFHQAMQYSINSVFCNIGKERGGTAILDGARKFGFYAEPPLETPDEEREPSGLYRFRNRERQLFEPRNDFQVDPGRLAFGQERMLVTPLQMAMVAAAVGNDGVLAKPQVVEKVVSPEGRTLSRLKTDELGRAMKPETAQALQEMMKSVVSAGTATAAQIPGVGVAGKTGTAETGVAGRNTTWFIGFAPADDPKYAIAVVVENQSGTGGAVSAPVAKAVLQALLQPASNA
jgi:peptidoglycan glycosyltransferase